jgi:hypothetical protein
MHFLNTLQITGEVDAVKKALQSVSQQLLENPPRDHDPSSANSSGPPSHSFGHFHPRPDAYPLPNRSFAPPGVPYSSGPRDVADYNSAPPLIAKYHETGIPGRMKPAQEVLTFRLLCHDERVGGVIGKGGAIIKTLKQETGCEIKVMEGVSDSQDRIIIISGAAVCLSLLNIIILDIFCLLLFNNFCYCFMG